MTTVQPKGSHYIGGSFVTGAGDAHADRYPATGEVIAEIRYATPAEVESAVEAAKKGAKVWAKTPGSERARVLHRAAEIMRERNTPLSRLETLDTGKPIQETLVADAASGADCFDYFAGLAGSLAGEHIDLGDDFIYTRREPLGIVAAIGAWNYPIQIASWKAAPALACGNAVIFKPSEVTPLSALALAEILTEAGLPDGVFNVLQGAGEVGRTLVTHPDIAKVSLTGEVGTGKRVMADASGTLKHVTLELGGKSPILVFEDADLDSAVGGAMLGNFYSSGQVCSNGTRVFVHESVKDAFLEKLVARTKALKIGDPLDPETHIGPLISAEHMEKVLMYMDAGKAEARCVAGGGRVAVPGLDNGYFVAPTIFDATGGEEARIVREEIFGPVLTVLSFSDEAEVIARANATPFGLAAGVFTRDLARAHRTVAALEAGTCWINTYNLTPIAMPFGGVKQSGLGRENGTAALDHYSQIKSVYVAMGPVDAPY
ncbi:MAG: betaine-aldehyde dehydrogenase [Hyphomicrobiales bacterium]|nr:MAG: betaine-aldehyde dehydrogenase [Hyphomicrobiales bacterium]